MDVAGIVRVISVLISLIPIFVVIAAGIAYLHVPAQGEERGVRNRLRRLKGKIHWGILVCVIYVGCYLCVAYIQARVNNSITIGLNYAEASQGLNPNGTRFNTYDIIDDDVLTQAIEDGNLGDISVSQLRDTLSVVPLHAGESVSTEQYYVSTEYALVYNASLSTLTLDGRHVLQSVADAFNEQFLETYGRKTDVLEMDYSDVDEADYLDKVSLLSKKSSALQNYLWKCYSNGSNYVSEDGETFSSLAQKIEDFHNVQLERLESYVLTNGLTQDRNRQLAKLNYKNLMLDIDYEKNTAAYDVRLETIDMYERDMATIVLVPTTDEDGEYYMSRTKIAVDNFANEADSYSQNAADLQLQISNNQYAIDQMENAEASEDAYSTADDMITSIETALSEYAARALDMVHDYDNETRGDYLVFTTNQSRFMRELAMSGAVLAVEMAAAYILAVALMPVKKSKERGASVR